MYLFLEKFLFFANILNKKKRLGQSDDEIIFSVTSFIPLTLDKKLFWTISVLIYQVQLEMIKLWSVSFYRNL